MWEGTEQLRINKEEVPNDYTFKTKSIWKN